MIEHFFNEKEKLENIKFSKKTEKWWNGHTYLPIHTYKLKEFLNFVTININYEFRKSEFNKPSIIDLGMYGDRHICNITCEIKSDKIKQKFYITERSFFLKLFNWGSRKKFKVHCKNDSLNNFLNTNDFLIEIYNIVENSAEFSPLIKGAYDNNNSILILTIRYNTQQESEKILNLFYVFCKDLAFFLMVMSQNGAY